MLKCRRPGLDEYAYVAPTLYDSTVTGGMVQTTFMIAGYTGDGKKLYASAADSGFSVDNLKPVKPVGVVAAVSERRRGPVLDRPDRS